MRRRSACNRGQSTVELALVTPVFFMLLLYVAQLGLLLNQKIVVTHAAREAARAVVVLNNPDAARQAALLSGNFQADRLQVRVMESIDDSTSSNSASSITVTVIYTAPTDIPLVGQLIGDVELSSTISMSTKA